MLITKGDGRVQGVDAHAGAYWQGAVTRGELQTQLDHINPLILELIRSVHGDNGADQVEGSPTAGQIVRQPVEGVMGIIAKLDCMVSFLMDKAGVSPADFQNYLDNQMKAFAAAQEKAKEAALATTTPAPTVTL